MESTATHRPPGTEANGNGRKGALHEASATLPDRTMAPPTNTGGGSTVELEGLGFDPEVAAAGLEEASAEEALRWALDRFSPRMYIACSFQKTSSVTVHMASGINPGARFFYLDTGLLFPETYETKDRLEQRYGIRFHRYSSITRDPQGRADALGPRRGRPLGLGDPPLGLADQGHSPQVRLGQPLRALEAQP